MKSHSKREKSILSSAIDLSWVVQLIIYIYIRRTASIPSRMIHSITHYFLLLLLCSSLIILNVESSSHTESILQMYKKISEKGSLNDGLDLNDRAQEKLKSINTIRLVTLNDGERNSSHRWVFNISLHRLRPNEEVKLIEFRFQWKMKKHRGEDEHFIWIHRQSTVKKQFQPVRISTDRSDYLSYDLTDHLIHNGTEQWLILHHRSWPIDQPDQVSLVIYSRVPGVFLLPKRSKRSISRPGPCARQDFFVNFDQLAFGEWVVEPKRFNAGICQGDCPNPLSRSYFPTNHAMLLSLLHERGQNPHQPSCVPVRLRPLDLVYYDRRELVIKRHQGMQVEECGCR